LTAWITAAALRPSTVRDFGSYDERVRSAAFDRLVRECRWPSLLSACVMLLFVYELGRVLGGWQVGVAAVLVCASTVLFLRQSRTVPGPGLGQRAHGPGTVRLPRL